jgi:hypothetical protein
MKNAAITRRKGITRIKGIIRKKGRKKMAIEIDIRVEAGMIVLTSNAGNIRAASGTEIVWTTKDPKRTFTLEFFTLTVDKQEDDSPFRGGAIQASVATGKPFRAQLREYFGLDRGSLDTFKYSVSSGSLTLDPTIVVQPH